MQPDCMITPTRALVASIYAVLPCLADIKVLEGI